MRADTPRPSWTGDEPTGHLIAPAPQPNQPVELPQPQLAVTAPTQTPADPSPEPASPPLATFAHPELSPEPGTSEFLADAADGSVNEGQGSFDAGFDGSGPGLDLDSPAEDFSNFGCDEVDMEAGAVSCSPSDCVNSPDEEFIGMESGALALQAGAAANSPSGNSPVTSPGNAAHDAGHLFASAPLHCSNLHASSPESATAGPGSPGSSSTGAVPSSPGASGQTPPWWLQPCSLSHDDWQAACEEEEEVSSSAAHSHEDGSVHAVEAVPNSPDNSLLGIELSSPAARAQSTSIWMQPSALSHDDWQAEVEEEEEDAASDSALHNAEMHSQSVPVSNEDEEQSQNGSNAAADEEEHIGEEEAHAHSSQQYAQGDFDEEEEDQESMSPGHEYPQGDEGGSPQGRFHDEEEGQDYMSPEHEDSQGGQGVDALEEGEEGEPQAVPVGMMQQWCTQYQACINQ